MSRKYKYTMYACYTGYITQAIVNNLAPLLFVIFHNELGIGFEKLGRLVLFNFICQITVDIIAINIVDKIGYRLSSLIANITATTGLILMGVLSGMRYPYMGLIIAIMVYAIGGGFFEVIVSPMVESLPVGEKQSNMAILHSFYCWGQAGVVLISTLIIKATGSNNWRVLPIIWSIVPLCNFFLFLKVPIVPPVKGEKATGAKKLFSHKSYIIFCLLIFCGGASELAMSQWSSMFAEKGLSLSKTTGDLLGPFMFAIFMGTGRVVFALAGKRKEPDILRYILVCSSICVSSYLITALSPFPIVSLIACAICGFSVSVMWPGIFSLSAKSFPGGGTAMFGILAISGDLGCAIAPWVTGIVSDIASKRNILEMPGEEFGLKCGLLAAAVFPAIMSITIVIKRYIKNGKINN